MMSPDNPWPYHSAPRPPQDLGFTTDRLADAFAGSVDFPDAQTRAALADFAADFPERMKVAREVEELVREVAKEAVNKQKAKYTEFAKKHQLAWGKAFRDVDLFAIEMVRGMLLNDTVYQDEEAIYWARTLFRAFGFTSEFHNDYFTAFRDGYKARLSPESYKRFEPFLERLIETMTDMADPEIPRV